MTNNEFDDGDLSHFTNRLSNRQFTEDICFLCARPLELLNPTSEHVIPVWAQKRFDLWNEKLTLLNGTQIPYRYLTVPCCQECNSYRLQPIEFAVSSALEQGLDAVQQLGHRILFLWLGKIFYGLIYKELFLSSDRSNPNATSIVPPELMERYTSHLVLLQEARGKLETVDFHPGSIFLFETQQPSSAKSQWDFCDNIDLLTIGIRMGKVGIIASLSDGGAQQKHEDIYDQVKQLPLHPLQFRELCAVITYRASLATRTPKYVTLSGRPHQMYQLPLAGFSLKPLFDKWENSDFVVYLSSYTGIDRSELYKADTDEFISFIYDSNGKTVLRPYIE